jgi:hypothetical protein
MTPTVSIITPFFFIVYVNNNSTIHGGFKKFKRSGVRYCILVVYQSHMKSSTDTGQEKIILQSMNGMQII